MTAIALATGIAAAQPSSELLIQSDTDALGQALAYPDIGSAEITGALVTMAPGDSTGWHSHPVPTFGYLLAGELTVDYATGERRTFRAGEAVVEAQHTPHKGHSSGNGPVSMLVFYAGASDLPTSEPAEPERPNDFVALRSLIPSLEVELRYLGSDNFTGRPVAGYEADIAYLTRPAAIALRAIQAELESQGLGLKVFDGYRPQRAVDTFLAWAADSSDTATKQRYYPAVDKASLIAEGYIAPRSGHSRGSTVDLTLIDLATGEEMDMGSPYDFFDPISAPLSDAVAPHAQDNRRRLRSVMLRHGFRPLEEEWWHFTLRDEPYPARYFDFPIR